MSWRKKKHNAAGNRNESRKQRQDPTHTLLSQTRGTKMLLIRVDAELRGGLMKEVDIGRLYDMYAHM